MEGRCERHQFDRAVDRCGRCGLEFCSTCIVYSFGPKKPPLCLPCAVQTAGVRSTAAATRALSRKERKLLARVRAEENANRSNAPVKAPVEVHWFDEPTPALSD
jgi:hypothetical protein